MKLNAPKKDLRRDSCLNSYLRQKQKAAASMILRLRAFNWWSHTDQQL
jgi:hypothetical protein